MSFKKNIGFIGAGAMAEALIKSLLGRNFVDSSNIWASDVNCERGRYLMDMYGINYVQDNKELVDKAELVIHAVKPFVLGHVLDGIASDVPAGQIHISLGAGISLEFIEARLPAGIPVVRVMPNTPCLIGEGASAYTLGSSVNTEQEEIVKNILECTGLAVRVPENLMNAVTGLSGSGPAYVFLVIEALIDGAVRAGLSRNVASALTVQTLIGAAKLVRDTGKHPVELKDMVTTPGGTTIAGLHILEKAGVRAALMDAVMAAAARAGELGKD
ncbi:pyrroline-5-carboxylate reductase [Phosphitispora sp. TUW77]|uniref:pyrroline-5-carboxylate reductase n=1 Tax=Phosphitispora sp. TUW77 TaxID=3152361 RepID=UPI003AB70ACB